MEQWQQWFQEKQVERTINALKKNNFEAVFVPDSKSACEEVMKQIPDGATVGVGGSITLTQIGLLDGLGNRNVHLIWPFRQGKTPEEILDLVRKSFSADVILSSTNAVTEDGKFSLEAVRCVGCCGLAPVVVIGPDLIGGVDSSKVGKLLRRHRKTGSAVLQAKAASAEDGDA